jgi:predicted NUDIX family phosphoesterase
MGNNEHYVHHQIQANPRLEQYAQWILNEVKLRPYRLKKPVVVEFAGMPRSGKSTTIEQVDHFFRKKGYRTRVIHEDMAAVPITEKFNPVFNLFTANKLLNELLKLKTSDMDLVLIDRGLFDKLCWFNWHFKTGRFSKIEYESTCTYLLQDRWRQMIDVVFVMNVNPRLAIKRELWTKLSKQTGKVIEESVLVTVAQVISESVTQHKSQFSKIVTIDNDAHGYQQTIIELVINNVLNIANQVSRDLVLAVPKKRLAQFKLKQGVISQPQAVQAITKQILTCGLLLDRDKVEEDPAYIQPIPAGIITDGINYLILRRKNYQRANDRLHNQQVLWVGGHVRSEDLQISRPLIACIKREVHEELSIRSIKASIKPLGIVYDESTPKSKRHLAFVYKLLSDPSWFKMMNHKRFYEYDNKFVDCGLANSASLREQATQVDAWSQLLLERHLLS